jgi:hypothetical protein
MTLRIDLPESLEAALHAHVTAQGVSEEVYVRTLVERDLGIKEAFDVERSRLAADRILELRKGNVLPEGSGSSTKKRLSELFAVLRGSDIDLTRNPSTGRPVSL